MKFKLLAMNKLSLSIIAIGSALLLGSCKKGFLDINKDPNRPTETVVSPDLAMAAQLNSSALMTFCNVIWVIGVRQVLIQEPRLK